MAIYTPAQAFDNSWFITVIACSCKDLLTTSCTSACVTTYIYVASRIHKIQCHTQSNIFTLECAHKIYIVVPTIM